MSRPCPACAAPMVPLPVPGKASVTSDGRRHARPLEKTLCPDCGLVAHAAAPDAATVRGFYDDDYDLAATVAPGDLERAEAYAAAVARVLPDRPRALFEAGCGAGHLLAALLRRWPGARASGVEAAPAVAAAAARAHPGIAVAQGFAEDLPDPAVSADLVLSVNVIEHSLDPAAFLAAQARQMAPSGRIVAICPAARPPSLELLFLDHIHTLSPPAMARFAEQAGLRIVMHDPAPEGLGDFQLFVLSRADADPVPALPPAAARDEIAAYLQGWAGLDAAIDARLEAPDAAPVALFGAGEGAALLRAYAPRLWDRAGVLAVDDPAGARALDRPVLPLTRVAPGTALVLATHPRGQAGLAARLTAEGHRVIAWNDLVPR